MKEPYVIVKGNSINEKLEMNIMYKAEDEVVVFKDKHNKIYSIDVPR